MSEYISESVKADIGLVPQTLNNSNATGRYFDMKNYHRACAICVAGAAADTKTTKLELLQATDAEGTDSKAITSASATATAPTNATKITIALSSVLNGQTVTINDVTFTAHTDTTTAADREFSISGTDSQDGDELASLINDSTYGVPGVTASNSSGTLTLTVDDPGATTITASASDSTFTLAVVEHAVYVEIDEFDLDVANDFTHVACKVTTTGNTPVGVVLLRGLARGAVSQSVGASAAV